VPQITLFGGLRTKGGKQRLYVYLNLGYESIEASTTYVVMHSHLECQDNLWQFLSKWKYLIAWIYSRAQALNQERRVLSWNLCLSATMFPNRLHMLLKTPFGNPFYYTAVVIGFCTVQYCTAYCSVWPPTCISIQLETFIILVWLYSTSLHISVWAA